MNFLEESSGFGILKIFEPGNQQDLTIKNRGQGKHNFNPWVLPRIYGHLKKGL